MYTEEDLIKYSFFSKLKIKYVLEQSTGVITKNYFIDFINSVIEEKQPFTLLLFEIDNFEQIMENYGSMLSEEFLQHFANSITAYIKDKGLVARYSAEKFMIILFGSYSYDELRAFLYDLYNVPSTPFKSRITISGITSSVSITTGTVSYPSDGKNINDLLTKLDKTIYRGKQKGRGCFIIYVDEKHRDIDVTKKLDETTINIMARLSSIIEKTSDIKTAAQLSLDYLITVLRISNAIILLDDKMIQSNRDIPFDDYGLNFNELDKLFNKNDIVVKYYDTALIEDIAMTLYDLFINNDVLSIIVTKIQTNDTTIGYILFCETLARRMWREKDESIIYFLSKLLGMKKLID